MPDYYEQAKIYLNAVEDDGFKKNPSHYTGGTIQPWDYIFAMGWGEGFCKGSAVKYISRSGKKDGEPETKDLKKAIDFLEKYISEISK